MSLPCLKHMPLSSNSHITSTLKASSVVLHKQGVSSSPWFMQHWGFRTSPFVAMKPGPALLPGLGGKGKGLGRVALTCPYRCKEGKRQRQLFHSHKLKWFTTYTPSGFAFLSVVAYEVQRQISCCHDLIRANSPAYFQCWGQNCRERNNVTS